MSPQRSVWSRPMLMRPSCSWLWVSSCSSGSSQRWRKASPRGSTFRITCVGLAIICCLLAAATSSASGAEPSLPERCMANGLIDLQDATGSTFNHHPEKKRELRSTDHFLSSLETDTSFAGAIADLPTYCGGSFHREGSIKLLFKTTKWGWRPLYKAWQPITWFQECLEEPTTRSKPEYLPLPETSEEIVYALRTGDDCTRSPWLRFSTHQNRNTFGLGCTTASRARLKLLIVDDQTSAIIAARLYTIPIQVESWYLARCLGRFSIQEQKPARRCSEQLIGGFPNGGPSLWSVRVKRVGCNSALKIGRRALRLPAFSEGAFTAQSVKRWKCYYASRGAVSCERRGRHIFMKLRGGVGERCKTPISPAGVKALRVVGSSCQLAAELATQLQAEPGVPSPVTREAGGFDWACAFQRYFEYDDRSVSRYYCYSGDAAIAFNFAEPKNRLIPVEQVAMSPGVILPGQGPKQLFTLTPEIKFSERVKWTRTKILLPLTVEPALVGKKARLKLEKLTAKCEWTSDEGQTSPICPSTRSVGTTRRNIVLKDSQTINVGPRKHRGNWVYRLTISTPAFSLRSLDYRETSHTLNFWMVNAATHCERNPWCHPNKKHR